MTSVVDSDRIVVSLLCCFKCIDGYHRGTICYHMFVFSRFYCPLQKLHRGSSVDSKIEWVDLDVECLQIYRWSSSKLVIYHLQFKVKFFGNDDTWVVR